MSPEVTVRVDVHKKAIAFVTAILINGLAIPLLVRIKASNPVVNNDKYWREKMSYTARYI